ncbi:cysteine-rich receptor-like protein kinase 8 [Tanacetum coccineum]
MVNIAQNQNLNKNTSTISDDDPNSPNHPLFLHQNDHPSLILISKKLTGSDKYGSWKRSMMIALNDKNKLKLVTGEYEEPAISNSLNFVNTACNLWKELQEHYSQLDGHRVYQLTNDLRSNFLMSSMPTVAKAYSMIRQEEKQREGFSFKNTSTVLSAQSNYTRNSYSNNTRFDNSRFGRIYSQGESSSRNNNQGESSRRSNFKKGVIYGKEGHTKEECYKIVGYPVGHPLHRKYKPSNQTLRNNTLDNNRTVNMTMSQENSNELSAATTSSDAAMSARMDQLQNQLNQMNLMMQNNKETNGMPFMSNEGKPKLIASCFTKSYKFIVSHVSAKRTTTRKLPMAASIIDCTSSNKNPKHLLLPSLTSTQTTWLSSIQDLVIPHFLF